MPLYGESCERHDLDAVVGAWIAQNVSCEVVIAVAGAARVSVSASGGVRLVLAPDAMRAPGLLRNLGVETAHAGTLYLSDADVAPVGTDYLSRALAAADGRVWCQPWMHRLVGCVPDLARARFADDPPAHTCCFVTADRDAVLRPMTDERIRWASRPGDESREPFPRARSPHADPTREREWRAPYHWGGVLLPRSTFADVGSYCPAYRGWGCEDDDLLVKLRSTTDVVTAWRTHPHVTCVHVEHDYPHTVTPQRRANTRLYRRRRAAGPAAMIARDTAAAGDRFRFEADR